MELHPLHRVLAMSYSHNGVILGPGGYLQAIGESLRHYRQRMIANGGEGVGEAVKNASIFVVDEGRLPVHNLSRRGNGASIGITDTLVTQTNAEDGNFSPEVADDIVGDAGVLWYGGAG